MFMFVLAALLLATPALSVPLQWPAQVFEPCATSSPDFKSCAMRNLQLAIDKFHGGVASLQLPSFDPLYVPEALFDYSQDNIEGKMIVKNTKCVGLKDAEVLDFRSNLTDPSNVVIDIDFHIPHVFIEGDYKAEGKIVAFPISGKGVYNISISDISGTWGLRGEVVTIEGEQFLRLRHVYMYPEVGDMKVYASNLFTGSEELNKAALRFANLYWRAFYKEMLPYSAQGWDKLMRGMLNRLLLSVPYSAIFPEN